ncbi:MAG: metallophosphoesterase [Ruminococcaceae bacterium]|nr:metallophosphoesterase [Oscillospiraceae bacterium]
MKKRAKKKLSPLQRTLVWLAAVLAAALYLYWGNTAPQVTRLDAAFADLPAGFDGCRIVLLSDLHGAAFGKENEDLFSVVAAETPDLIALTGDLIDEDTPDPLAYAAETAARLSAIAPTYYVTGNHEWAAGDVRELKSVLEESGVTVLSNEYLLWERGGDAIAIAGIDDPNGYADQKTPETLAAELYADLGDPFWILLAHRNDKFASQYSLLGADLVLSGHGHGGVIRLPFTDGLLGTQHNLLPSYTAGLYEENGSALLVSRGLGNVGITFRAFNRPDIAVLTLHKGT